MKYLLTFLFLIGSVAWSAEDQGATLLIEPSYSLQQKQGINTQLNISQHLKGKWWLAPQAQWLNISTYQDMNARLDLEYHYSDLLTFEVGEGYDNYHYYGDTSTLSHEGHAGVKVKLW